MTEEQKKMIAFLNFRKKISDFDESIFEDIEIINEALREDDEHNVIRYQEMLYVTFECIQHECYETMIITPNFKRIVEALEYPLGLLHYYSLRIDLAYNESQEIKKTIESVMNELENCKGKISQEQITNFINRHLLKAIISVNDDVLTKRGIKLIQGLSIGDENNG